MINHRKFSEATYVAIIEYCKRLNKVHLLKTPREMANDLGCSKRTIECYLSMIKDDYPREHALLTRYIKRNLENKIQKLAIAWGEAVLSDNNLKVIDLIVEIGTCFRPTTFELKKHYRLTALECLYLNRLFNEKNFLEISKKSGINLPVDYLANLAKIESYNASRSETIVSGRTK